MPSLYQLLLKSAPLCHQHINNQALLYNIEQHSFLCQQCIHSQSISFQNINNNLFPTTQSSKKYNSTFSLSQIVQNPILLMLRHNNYFSQTNSQSNKYHIDEFIKILTDIDNFIKTKKSSHQSTKQYFTYLKQQFNDKINSILQKSQQNYQLIQQIEENSSYLKKINNDYYNQFLQTLESTYINGSTQELNELLKKYSIQNQNPFRRVQQKVIQITKDISNFVQINWNHCLQLQRKILDPYIWSEQKLFMIPNLTKLSSKKQQNLILPNSYPYLLGFQTSQLSDQININNSQQNILNQSKKNQIRTYVKCTYDGIQLFQKKCQPQDQFTLIDKFQSKNNLIDILYQLPQKILMTVSYSNLNFYSYQFNQIKQVSQLNTLKGCSEVLIFDSFCIILAQNSLFRIWYSQLNKFQKLKLQIQGTQTIFQINYLYKDQCKMEDYLLLKCQNRSTNQYKTKKIKLI